MVDGQAARPAAYSRGRASARLLPGLAGTCFLAAALALGLTGCGGGGSTPAGGSGAIQGTVDSRQILQSLGNGAASAVSPDKLQVMVVGTGVTGTVSANNSFSLPTLPAGDYVVSVQDGKNGGHPTVAGYAKVHVVSGQTTPVDVQLLPAGFVAGVVSTNSNNGTLQPVSGVTVTLTVASSIVPPVPVFMPPANPPIPAVGGPAGVPTPSGTASLTLTATSASDGSFTFAGVPAGLYSVSATSGNLSATDIITVSPASASVANLVLEPQVTEQKIEVHGTVSGQAADGTTKPLANATVSVEMPEVCSGIPGGVGSGGSAGGGSATGGVSVSGSGTITPTGTGIAVRSRQAIACPPLMLGPPVPGAGPDLAPFYTVHTDQNGNYDIIVPQFVTGLVAYASGYQSLEQAIPQTSGASVVLDFTLQPVTLGKDTKATITTDGEVNGAVTTAPGTPIPFTLTLTNTSSHDVTVGGFFPAVQLTAVDSSGNVVWTSGYGVLLPAQPMIAMPVRVLHPGDSTSLNETWFGYTNSGLPVPDGDYVVQGTIWGVATDSLTVHEVGAAAIPPPSPPIGPAPVPPPPGVILGGDGSLKPA